MNYKGLKITNVDDERNNLSFFSGWRWFSKDIHVLIPEIYKYIRLLGKRDLKLQMEPAN